MTTKKYNHIHKFRRDRYSTGRAFYYCIQPDCTFKIDVKHSLGKHTICNKCGTIFTMNDYSIRSAKPICMNCVNRKTVNSDVNLDDIMGVKLDATSIDRNNERQSANEVRANPVEELENQMANILIKEYNPEDESDEL